MERRKFTKGLLSTLALIVLPITHAIKEVKKRWTVKTYTIDFKYDFKNHKMSEIKWIHKKTEEIEL